MNKEKKGGDDEGDALLSRALRHKDTKVKEIMVGLLKEFKNKSESKRILPSEFRDLCIDAHVKAVKNYFMFSEEEEKKGAYGIAVLTVPFVQLSLRTWMPSLCENAIVSVLEADEGTEKYIFGKLIDALYGGEIEVLHEKTSTMMGKGDRELCELLRGIPILSLRVDSKFEPKEIYALAHKKQFVFTNPNGTKKRVPANYITVLVADETRHREAARLLYEYEKERGWHPEAV